MIFSVCHVPHPTPRATLVTYSFHEGHTLPLARAVTLSKRTPLESEFNTVCLHSIKRAPRQDGHFFKVLKVCVGKHLETYCLQLANGFCRIHKFSLYFQPST